MTRDPCTLCGRTGHRPADCPMRDGIEAEYSPEPEPEQLPLEPFQYSDVL